MTGQNRTKASLARFLRWAAALGLLACTAHDLAGQVLVTGTVTDRSSVPVPEVRLVVESRDGTMARADATSGRDGAFRFRLDRPGRFFLSVDHPGFFSIEGKPIDLAAGANIVNVELIRSEDGGTAVEIRAREQLAAEEIAMSQALDEEEIDTVPMSRSTKQRIQGVAAILPGVLRHPYGELHFHGSPAQETNWVLDGFNVTDPATGRLEMALGAESVGSMDLLAGRYSAALGKGAGGAMVVRTRTGEDQFRQGFTNFVPGIDFEQGLRIRDWRPRYAVSGPIVENRALVLQRHGPALRGEPGTRTAGRPEPQLDVVGEQQSSLARQADAPADGEFRLGPGLPPCPELRPLPPGSSRIHVRQERSQVLLQPR